MFPDVIEVLQYVEKEDPNDAKRRQTPWSHGLSQGF
jgi:hypothetical protein